MQSACEIPQHKVMKFFDIQEKAPEKTEIIEDFVPVSELVKIRNEMLKTKNLDERANIAMNMLGKIIESAE